MTLLSAVDVRLSLPGLTKLISKLNKAGRWRQGLTVFHVLPSLGLVPDATVANAALGACDRGGDGAAAWGIFEIMEVCALEADAISYKALVAALSKSGYWRRCVLVFIRAVETGVPLEAMTVMAIISALNDAAHPRLAEGVFACAFASALDLQPLLTLAWPEDQWASPGVRGNSPLAPEQGADHGPYSLADRGAEAVAGRAQVWSSNRMLPPSAAQEGGPAVFALQAAAQAAGSPLLRMTSDESIRAAVNAASALDDPQATPQALLARLQVLQAQARHASQTTRLNTYLKLYGDMDPLESRGLDDHWDDSNTASATAHHQLPTAVCASDTENGTSSAETLRRGLHDPQPPLRDASPPKSRARPSHWAGMQPMSSFCNSITSDMQYAVRAQATSLSESDAMHLTSAAVGSPVSSRDAAAGKAAAAATGITVPSIAAPIGSATAALVSNTRRALGGVAHDPMARACCNAMLAGYADATPAAGDRAVALLQILRESEALEPDVVAYNTTVRALAVAGHLQAAVDTLAQLTRSGHRARTASFLPLLAGAAASGSVRSVLELRVQMQRMNISPDISCTCAFTVAALRSGSGELMEEALSRVTAQMSVMSAAKASAESSSLVLAHAEHVPRELWTAPGMTPCELFHALLHPRGARNGGDDHVGMSPSRPRSGKSACATGPHDQVHGVRDRQQWAGQAAAPPVPSPQPAAPSLGMMCVVPQAVRAGAPAHGLSNFSVNVAYPTVGAPAAAPPVFAHGLSPAQPGSRRAIPR